MKIKLTQLSIMLFLALLATVTKAQKVDLGVKAGLNYFNITRAFTETNPEAGFHAGIFGEVNLSELTIRSELTFNRQTYSLTQNVIMRPGNVTVPFDQKNSISFVSVPILVKTKAFKWISIETGVQTEFLAQAKATTTNLSNGDESVNIYTDGLNTVTFSGVLGISMKLPQNLEVGARYNLGISNILSGENGSVEMYNRAVQFSVGYAILGKRST